MRKPEKTTIGSYTYTVAMLPPREANRLLLRVLKAAGPALSPILTAAGGSLKDVAAAVRGIGDEDTARAAAVGGALVKALGDEASWLDKATQRLVEALKEEELDVLINTLQGVTTVEHGSKPLGMLAPNFDLCFGEDLKEMYLWLWFAWKVQYASFFSSLARGLTT